MAMKIGGQYKFSEIQVRHWDQFVEGAGLARAAAKKRVLELAKSLPPTAHELQAAPGLGFDGNAVVENIVVLIEQRCALTIKRLTNPTVESE
jgi:serine/threonine-protein kinase HipA